jgi:hypothetical protein
VPDAIVVARIAEELGPVAGQMMPLIWPPEKSGEWTDDGGRRRSVVVEHFVIKRWMLRKGMLGAQNPVFINLLEHPYLFG